jgi:hypothetical protein
LSFDRPGNGNTFSSAAERLATIFAALARPTEITVDWIELDSAGVESRVHELDTRPASTWSEVPRTLDHLSKSFVIEAVIIELDAHVDLNGTPIWCPDAFAIAMAVDNAAAPTGLAVELTTFVDAWVSRTQDDTGSWRNNPDAASNGPKLERVLRDLAAWLGGPLRNGKSHYYGHMVRPTGFESE